MDNVTPIYAIWDQYSLGSVKVPQTLNERITGQAEAIVRSATAAAGQDDGFVEDPEFEEFLCADTRSGAVGRGNPGWYFYVLHPSHCLFFLTCFLSR